MAAVQPTQGFSEPIEPRQEQAQSGLKPISRLISGDRISRIVPETESNTDFSFCSTFARDFIRANYNFCASKFSVARGGKTLALDTAFREADEWFPRALDWIKARNQFRIPMGYEEIDLAVTNPLAGRLLRLLRQYDKLFTQTLFAQVARSISPAERDAALDSAARKIGRIHALSIPNNDRFTADGRRADNDDA